jgi:hypothetical protein
LSLTIGGQDQLAYTIQPSNATNKNVAWSSSNSAVATVSGGLVTAVAVGNATITVTTVDGGKTDTCNVSVSSSDNPWYQGNARGQISAYPSSGSVVLGGVLQFQFTAGDPFDQSNTVKSWAINGGLHPGSNDGDNRAPSQAQISSGGLFTFAPTADVYPNLSLYNNRILFGVRANFERDNVIAYQNFYITVVPNSTSVVKVVAVGPPLVFRSEH